MPSLPDERDVLEQRFVELGGYRHAYACAIPPRPLSPPIIAVHGFGTSGYRTYRHIAADLFDAGVPLYALDLLGFGDSEAPQIDYSLSRYARLIAECCRRLHLERPIVAGHSMGGKVAAACAVLNSAVFSGLILINSGGFSTGERWIPRLASFPGMHGLIDSDWFYFRVLPLTPFGAILQTEENRQQLHLLRYSHAELDLRESDILRRLPHLSMPTLVVWGDADPVLPRRTPYVVQRYLPNARLRMISGAGHAPMKDRPSAVAKEIAAFAGGLGA